MEPKISVPNSSQEIGGYNQQMLPPHPEVISGNPAEVSPEHGPVQQERQSLPAQSAPVLPVLDPKPFATPASVVPVLNPVPNTVNNPAVAGDDEVIEKEWVDKAKKIVAATKDDPYRQEQEVSKLQADYIKKRYGKEVKLASD